MIGMFIGVSLLVIGLMGNLLWQYELMGKIFIDVIFYYKPSNILMLIGILILIYCLLKLYEQNRH